MQRWEWALNIFLRGMMLQLRCEYWAGLLKEKLDQVENLLPEQLRFQVITKYTTYSLLAKSVLGGNTAIIKYEVICLDPLTYDYGTCIFC